MTRGEGMLPGKVQISPRGRWKLCIYRDNGDGTVEALVGAKLYTVATDQIKAKGVK